MSRLLNAADTIERELNRMAGLRDAADAFRRIGSLEQAEEDAKRRHDEVQGKVHQVEAALKASEEKAAAELAKASNVLQSAGRQAAEIIDQATRAAKEVEANANASAATIVDEGRAAGEQLVEAATARRLAIDELMESNRVKVVELERQIQVKRAELESFGETISKQSAKLAAARAKLKQLLDG